MIAGQTDATLRRLPVYLSTTAGVGVAGLTFSGSDIQLSTNGGAWTNFTGTMTEIGSGAYYYEFTLAELVQGLVLVKIIKSPAQELVERVQVDDAVSNLMTFVLDANSPYANYKTVQHVLTVLASWLAATVIGLPQSIAQQQTFMSLDGLKARLETVISSGQRSTTGVDGT